MRNYEAAYVAGIIDGEGSITLTRMHKHEYRRPCITIPSTDKELLFYVQSLTGGNIISKKNYNPSKHKNSYTLDIKVKNEVFLTLEEVYQFLRIERKRKRAELIITMYNQVTPRNGKYNEEALKKKMLFEKQFFQL